MAGHSKTTVYDTILRAAVEGMLRSARAIMPIVL
jgi:hypothetical protein